MSELKESASCFEAVLAAELKEIENRQALRAMDLTDTFNLNSETTQPENLYPTRKLGAGPSIPHEINFGTVPRAKAENRSAEGMPDSAESPKKSSTAIQRANHADLLGLAFSGGGIRSATFNLGVLQGLAKRKLLHRFDYLSTISGGGYIGAWLTAWIYRRGMREVEKRLGVERKDQPGFKSPPEIEFLREYSNYLTPRKGLLGADTWTAIAIYLRNLILNQLILILFIASILLVPRALVAFAQKPPHLLSSHQYFFPIAAFVVICLFAVPTIFKNMKNYTMDPDPDRVLARVVAQAKATEPEPKTTELEVRLFRSDTPTKFRDLLDSHPSVEIWDSTITHRRDSSDSCRIRDFKARDNTADTACEGTMYFKGPVSAKVGDLIIAAYPEVAQPNNIFRYFALPIFVGSVIVSCLLAHDGRHCGSSIWTNLASPWWWACAGGVTLFVLWLLAFFLFGRNLDESKEGGFRDTLSKVSAWLSPWIAGAVGALLLWNVTPTLEKWHTAPAGMWKVLGFGAPLVALILLACSVIQIGILGVVFSEPRREWWARFAAMLMILCFAWAAAFALAGYGPLLLLRLWHFPKSTWLTAIGWAVSTYVGVLGAKSAKAGALDSHSWKDIALSVTPYIFIVGLLMLVSVGLHASLLPKATGVGSPPSPAATAVEVSISGEVVLPQTGTTPLQLKVTRQERTSVPSDRYWKDVESSLGPGVYWALLICFGASVLLALRVDLNEFSMHYLYRNRLVRCYLGASHRERVPNPFTGFDVNDDIHLAAMTTKHFYDGPIPIFGAALNLVHGKDLAWQERKAESFAMTPLFCGFDAWFERSYRPGQYEESDLDNCAFRPTRTFAYPDGLYLGTAIAISGAAASPNMGYHSSPALAFLMTVFNVRLGWWVGNPRRPDRWKNAGPLFGLGYLLAELFGATDDTGSYVYLSDGGHFENLGLYELVKRRCRFIIASDADADKGLAFGDLASAIRKCRSDMGIDIKLRTDRIVASGSPPFSKWHCTIADILYEGSDQEAKNGILLYIKVSLTSDESADILNYKSEYPDFPHQSTANQWFTESQFESYRALGEHVITSALHGLPASMPPALDNTSLDDLFKALAKFWKNPEVVQACPWPPDTGP